MNLKVETVVTEVRVYADKQGNFIIPTQYRSDGTYGENVKTLSVALYSEGVMANDRIAASFNVASGNILELPDRNIYSFCKKLAQNSAENILHKKIS